MVKTMHRIVMQSMKIVVQMANYIIVSYDEVTNWQSILV
jgi:flagellar hook-basal body complex protein FliE